MLKKRTNNMSDYAKMLTMKIPPCPTEKYLKIRPIYYSLRKTELFVAYADIQAPLHRSFSDELQKH